MELAPMRYKNYTWPHNPRVYTIEYKRELRCLKVPYGRYHLQNLGMTRRIMRGEGEFVGPEAYQEFKKLATVFYGEGPGMLIHPVWQASNAYFVQLSLSQEPRPDYVRYTFTFWECFDGYGPQKAGHLPADSGQQAGVQPEQRQPSGEQKTQGDWHTVRAGETIWGIALKYGKQPDEVIRMNPQLKNPNLIHPGERVRVG